MKRLFLLVAMAGLVCGSCDKNNDEAPNNGGVYDQTLAEATLAIDQLIADIEAGRKYMKVYKQMKMYNDPSLNPVLYGNK